MTRLSMADRKKQITRLIRTYITQFDAALSQQDWNEIHRLSREVNRLSKLLHESTDYKDTGHAEIMALQLTLQKVQRKAREHHDSLESKLSSFRQQQEGLRAYQEAQGWQ